MQILYDIEHRQLVWRLSFHDLSYLLLYLFGVMAGIIQFDDAACNELFIQYHKVNVFRLYFVEI